jgi:hypothetical protein
LAEYGNLDILVTKLNEQTKRRHPTKSINWAEEPSTSETTKQEVGVVEFQWKDLLIPKKHFRPFKVRRDFLLAHNRNVQMMQALLDDPVTAISSKFPVMISKLDRKKLLDSQRLLQYLLKCKEQIMQELQQLWSECWKMMIEGPFYSSSMHFQSKLYHVTATWSPIMLQFWDISRSKEKFSTHQQWLYNGSPLPTNLQANPILTTVEEGLQYVFSQSDRMQQIWLTPLETCSVEFDSSQNHI